MIKTYQHTIQFSGTEKTIIICEKNWIQTCTTTQSLMVKNMIENNATSNFKQSSLCTIVRAAFNDLTANLVRNKLILLT